MRLFKTRDTQLVNTWAVSVSFSVCSVYLWGRSSDTLGRDETRHQRDVTGLCVQSLMGFLCWRSFPEFNGVTVMVQLQLLSPDELVPVSRLCLIGRAGTRLRPLEWHLLWVSHPSGAVCHERPCSRALGWFCCHLGSASSFTLTSCTRAFPRWRGCLSVELKHKMPWNSINS